MPASRVANLPLSGWGHALFTRFPGVSSRDSVSKCEEHKDDLRDSVREYVKDNVAGNE
jgi:hypothetical protein